MLRRSPAGGYGPPERRRHRQRAALGLRRSRRNGAGRIDALARSSSSRAVPFLRGLVRLGASLSPLFRRRGIARPRERLLLVFALIAPFLLPFLPSSVSLVATIALGVGLIAFLFRGRTLQLHGAEHRAIAAVEGRRLLASWDGDARPSRFSLRCGTNFAALALPVSVAMHQALWPLPIAAYTPFAVLLLSLALTMEFGRRSRAPAVGSRARSSSRVSGSSG